MKQARAALHGALQVGGEVQTARVDVARHDGLEARLVDRHLAARSISIFGGTLSTQVTSMPNSARHAPVTSPTYPVPTTQICMR